MGLVRQFSSGGTLSLVPAQEAVVDVNIRGLNVSAAELDRISSRPFKEKLVWFWEKRDLMKIPWENGHQKLTVRRERLLEDSLQQMAAIRPEYMWQIFRFQFKGEEGIDAGGLAREWFQIVSEQLFNPDFGLFGHTGIGGEIVSINQSSSIANENHLEYFHFAGSLLGKALFDGQVIQATLALPLYKHLLATPVTMNDLEIIDADLLKNLKQMLALDDVSLVCQDFTVTESVYGATSVVELKEGGKDIEVDNDNVNEYIQCLVKYYLLDRIKDQLSHFLAGFYEVIPQPLLSIFTFQELELVLCGLPSINVDDWKKNSIYKGKYEHSKANAKQVKWFWDVVRDELDDAQRARLLQFTTGTSKVPVQGFALLGGRDGSICKFCITSVELKDSVYPLAHTCFNRIELPLYKSKEQLRKFLAQVIQMDVTGFGME